MTRIFGFLKGVVHRIQAQKYTVFRLRCTSDRPAQSGDALSTSYFILHLLYDVMLIPFGNADFRGCEQLVNLFRPSLPGGPFLASYSPSLEQMG
jgi:hypothetical protein